MDKKERGRKAGNIILAIGIVFFVIACVLVIDVHINQSKAAAESEAALKQLQQMIPDIDTDSSGINGDTSGPLSVFDYKGSSYIGILSVPDRKLSWPVEDENGSGEKVFACIGGSPYKDSFEISGPDFKGVFADLKKLKEDDKVVFTDVYGNKTEYTVDSTVQMPKKATSKTALTITARKPMADVYMVSCVKAK